MTGKERIRAALAHQETGVVPCDLAGTLVTGIAAKAYAALREYIGLPARPLQLASLTQGLAAVDEDLLDWIGVDTRGVHPPVPDAALERIQQDSSGRDCYRDEWGLGWVRPQGGLYFDIQTYPLQQADLAAVKAYTWPEPRSEAVLAGAKARIAAAEAAGKAVCFGQNYGNGFLHTGNWLCSHSEFLCDLALGSAKADFILGRILEQKMAYWDYVLEAIGERVDVIFEQDDLGTQQGPFISPELYHRMIQPRQQELYSSIKQRYPHIRIFFHSCGSIRRFIPDLIAAGVDALNPVQVSAAEMDTKELKREFGGDIAFWGGGIDTQQVLPRGTPAEVKAEVRRRVDDLAPGGGFVFATVHNIQADVPPENLVAMWEALQES